MSRIFILAILLISYHAIIAQITFSKNIDINGYSDTGTGMVEFQDKYFIAASSLCEGTEYRTKLNFNNAGRITPIYCIISTCPYGFLKGENGFSIRFPPLKTLEEHLGI